MQSALLLIVAVFVSSGAALAANRTVRFSQVATSTARFSGFATAQTARCSIVIYNPSSTTQAYTVTAPLSTAGVRFSCSGAVNASSPCTPPTAVSAPSSLTGSLAQGQSVVLTWTFPAFPANTTGEMTYFCSGTIAVQDSTGNRGFVQASGEITGWTEEGTATIGSNTISGGAKLNSTRIPIEEGRLF